MTYQFPKTEHVSTSLYIASDAVALGFFGLLSQNLWEGYVAMSGETSGHAIAAYTGPYSVIKSK